MSEGATAAGPQTSSTPAPATNGNGANGHATPSNTRAPEGGSTASTPAPTSPPKHRYDFGDGEKEYTAEQVRTWAMKGRGIDKLGPKQERRIMEAEEKAANARRLEEMAEAGDVDGLISAISKWKGMTPEKAEAMAERILLPRIQAHQLTPEQRAILQERQAREAAENKLREIEHRAQQTEYEQNVKRANARVVARLDKALSSLKLAPEAAAPLLEPLANKLQHIAELNQAAMERGEEPLDYNDEEVAILVRDEARTLGANLTQGMNFNAIREFYGWTPEQLWQGMTGAEVREALGPAMELLKKAEYERILSERRGGTPTPTPQPQATRELPKKTQANPNGYLTHAQMVERGIL